MEMTYVESRRGDKAGLRVCSCFNKKLSVRGIPFSREFERRLMNKKIVLIPRYLHSCEFQSLIFSKS